MYLYLPVFVLFLESLSFFCPHITYLHLSKPQYDSQHTLTGKMPEFLTICLLPGKSICLTADRFLCLSAYLTGCLLSTRRVCFGILFLLALQPCFSVFSSSVLCLSAYMSTSLPACLLGSVSSHPARLTPDNATRASNRGMQQSSVKVIET